MQQFKNPTIISRETMENIMFDIPEIDGKKGDYGLGIKINNLEGHQYFNHGGVNAGFRTAVQYYAEEDLMVILWQTPTTFQLNLLPRILHESCLVCRNG